MEHRAQSCESMRAFDALSVSARASAINWITRERVRRANIDFTFPLLCLWCGGFVCVLVCTSTNGLIKIPIANNSPRQRHAKSRQK